MSSLVLSGDTSGTVTVSVPAVAGTNTVTIPAVTGTALVSGNQPAFSAYQSATVAMANATNVKITCDTEEFDTNSNYDTTNYRFTPTVAGYYQVNGAVTISAASSALLVQIYKNGSVAKRGSLGNATTNSSNFAEANVSAIIYLNGTTDYIELWASQTSGGSVNNNIGSNLTYFQACLLRTA